MSTINKTKTNALSKKIIDAADCIVIKIGSALLVDEKSNSVRENWLGSVAADVHRLKSEGKRVVIVSSGSIALGRHLLSLPATPLNLEKSQAAAAVGQIFLAQSYKLSLDKYQIVAAQILVTAEDSQNRRRYLNCRATLLKLLEMGVVPIVNENDTIATDEIKFGDNDRLAAQIASLCEANVLVLLSDVDGLYTSNPDQDRKAQHVPIVRSVTPEVEAMVKDNESHFSKGGMKTKIDAARVCMSTGSHMVITSGRELNPLRKLRSGHTSTWFLSSKDPIAARKQWIFNTKPKGKIFIDLGAEIAILKGKSLLPAGVIKCEGRFQRGDTVMIISSKGRSLANGLSCYSDEEVSLIKGCQSSEIATVLGHPGRSVLIHRNDMAI